MPVFKRCSRCYKRILEGQKCDCVSRRYKEDDKYRVNTEERRFYSSSSWEKKREEIKRHYNKLDIYSYYVLHSFEYGEVVHHVIPIENAWELRYDNDNLIYLTESNHRKLHNEMNRSEHDYERVVKMLKGLIALYEKEFIKDRGLFHEKHS